MPTTTIRIEDDLKARIAAAATRAGKSPHAFILDVLTHSVEADEHAAEFHRLAETRWQHLLASGESVPWNTARTWLEARVRGERPARPVAGKPAA
ncbi:MAG: CopG family transcriptional regulator [Alphaproteobacteria bacterium]|nr:CopG family transcriptional regulator [Alphaproteobacteria bacterium]